MEQELLQFIGVFAGGAVFGIIFMLIMNKLGSGSASPSAVKQEFDSYQNDVERHFEETSKKFKDMTAQYQDLYKHLSVGATSLCRPDSVAATLADQRSPIGEPAKIEKASKEQGTNSAQKNAKSSEQSAKKSEENTKKSEQSAKSSKQSSKDGSSSGQNDNDKVEKAKLEKARLEAKLENAKLDREKKGGAQSEQKKSAPAKPGSSTQAVNNTSKK